MRVFYLVILISMCFVSCAQNSDIKSKSASDITSDEYWKDSLSQEEYNVLRKNGTEPAFTGKHLENHENGTFVCNACKLPLFLSTTKFKSGTGWPSFSNHIDDNVQSKSDQTHGMVRDEIHCKRCKGHLGHVFEDGPQPTGLRYCINSVSLDFKAK